MKSSKGIIARGSPPVRCPTGVDEPERVGQAEWLLIVGQVGPKPQQGASAASYCGKPDVTAGLLDNPRGSLLNASSHAPASAIGAVAQMGERCNRTAEVRG